MTHKIKSVITYRTLDFYVLLKSIIFRILIGILAVYSFWHYKENPWLTTIIGLIFLFFFLIIGDKELILYNDKIKYTNDSFYSFLFRPQRNKIFYLKDINCFKVSGTFSRKIEIITDFSSYPLFEPFNTIDIKLKDGTSFQILTKIYIDKLKKTEHKLNKQLESL